MIVRTLDSAWCLERNIASIRTQTVQAEIIVVDSGSSDATLAIAERLADRVVTIAPRDFSYGRALNLGAAAASAPVHFALSSHCTARRRDWIERSLAYYERREVAATGGQDARPDGSPLVGPLFFDGSSIPSDNPFWGFSNHACSWRSSVWEQAPFDEQLDACEDQEWALRVCGAGWLIAFDPALHVSSAHRQAQGTRALYRRTRREAQAIAAFRGLPTPSLRAALHEWWSAHPPNTKAHRQRLSPYRISVIAARYMAARDAEGARGARQRRPARRPDRARR